MRARSNRFSRARKRPRIAPIELPAMSAGCSPAAAAAHQDEVALADLTIQGLGGETVREALGDLGACGARGGRAVARGWQQLVGRRELDALWIEKRPQQVLQ